MLFYSLRVLRDRGIYNKMETSPENYSERKGMHL
jgi:hypothetical protein